MVAMAGAQGRVFTPTPDAKITTITPDLIAKIGPTGERQSALFPMLSKKVSRNVVNWQVAFDSMNTNPATMASYSGFYGTGGTAYHWGNTWNILSSLNDMTLAAGKQGKLAQRVKLGLIWNPNGTSPRSGTADLMVRIWCVNNFGPDTGPAYSDRISGVEVIKRAVVGNSSNLILDIDFTALSGVTLVGSPKGLPLPGNNLGGIMYQIGTTDASNVFMPLSGQMCAAPIFSQMYSPGERYLPGTNPTASTEYDWQDDSSLAGGSAVNFSDYLFQDYTGTAGAGDWSELRSSDNFSAGAGGVGQPAVGLFVDPAARLITGTLTLNSRVATAPKPTSMSYKLYSGTTLVDQGTASLSDGLKYTIPDPNANGGTYSLIVKTLSYLGKKVAVTTTASNPTTANITMTLLGDITRDDVVNLSDFSALSSLYGRNINGENWQTPITGGWVAADADFNGDGVVNLSDFSMLSTNYGKRGDLP